MKTELFKREERKDMTRPVKNRKDDKIGKQRDTKWDKNVTGWDERCERRQ